MGFPSIQALIDKAMFMARIPGEIPFGEDPVIGADIEAAAWAGECLQDMSEGLANDPEKRHYITQTVEIPLTDGAGDLPPEMMSEYIDTGLVTDADGKPLVRVHHKFDFVKWLPPVYDYFCLDDNKIHTKTGSGSIYDVPGPLKVTCAMSFSLANLGDIPDALNDELASLLAARIRFGVLAKARAPQEHGRKV